MLRKSKSRYKTFKSN